MTIFIAILSVIIMCQLAALTRKVEILIVVLVRLIEDKKKKEELNNNVNYN